MERSDQILAQILEDAIGCRAVVAGMLLLDLPPDIDEELAACDQDLTRLIVAALRHLGLSVQLN